MNVAYRDLRGNMYDVSSFSAEEKELLQWLKLEYAQSESWTELQSRTAHGIITYCQKVAGGNWSEHPLFRIQLDLVGNLGIKLGELRGELSDMFVDE